jgi:uncharacterized protein (TIGR02453 family)
MLQPETIGFLKKLSKNNNKQWFDSHKEEYLAAKEDFEALVTDVLSGLSEQDAAFKQQKAKDCVMRIYRDIRFSADKTPYKSNFAAGFSAGGRKSAGGGYYLHIEPGGKCFAGGGMWMPESQVLKAIRQEIDYNFDEFQRIINDKKFKKFFGEIQGERLKKMPQGYTDDNPAGEYLKLKSFVAGYNIPDEDITKKGVAKKINEVYSAMKPFVDFLNRAISS